MIKRKKTDQFEDIDNRLANIAKALSHPARIEILRTLAQRNTCNCCDVVNSLPLAQSTVSQHLRELLNANLITGKSDGTKSCYCINESVLREITNCFKKLFEELDECCKKK